MQNPVADHPELSIVYVPFGVTYEKIGTIQRRLAWPLHKDDTLSRSGRSTDLNIYFALYLDGCIFASILRSNTYSSNTASSSSLRKKGNHVACDVIEL